MTSTYDIVIVGSGIAGSSLALVLKSLDCNILVIERGEHPRFAIGESTLPTTTLLFRDLARVYEVPEMEQISHYLELCDIGVTAFPKQEFWFGLHEEGKSFNTEQELMFETPILPIGPDTHVLRSDLDGFLVSRLKPNKIEYRDKTEVLEFFSPDENGIAGLDIRVLGSDKIERVNCKLMVDCSGHASFLAKQLDLRDKPATSWTDTRTIFSHFTGVADIDEVMGGCSERFRFRRDAGTMHHCFDGGWIWCIPFDDDVMSVGILLDRSKYPLDPLIKPEDEFKTIIARFPTLEILFKDAKPTRKFVGSDRIQFTTKNLIGPGYVISPHASGFVEPLFSSGILLTLTFIWRFVPVVKEALKTGDFSAARFAHLEHIFNEELRQTDRIVSGLIRSFHDFRVMKQYWRLWLYGSNGQLGHHFAYPDATVQGPIVFGSCYPDYVDTAESMRQLVYKDDGGDHGATAEKLKALIEPWSQRIASPALFDHTNSWAVDAKGGLAFYANLAMTTADDSIRAWVKCIKIESPYQLEDWTEKRIESNRELFFSQVKRYSKSKEEGGSFHLAYDRIVSQRSPSFPYAVFPGGMATINPPLHSIKTSKVRPLPTQQPNDAEAQNKEIV
jgi:FADH2 O2-dependent halogenase